MFCWVSEELAVRLAVTRGEKLCRQFSASVVRQPEYWV